jgi:hypothetical protein
MRQVFPSREEVYSSSRGDNTVGPMHHAVDVRDALLSALIARGTPEAHDSLKWIVENTPEDERIWIRWKLRDGIEKMVQLTWARRRYSPHDVRTMLRDPRVTSPQDSEDLLAAVLDSLARLQQRLLTGTSTEIRALWNESSGSVSETPKDEEALSEVVCQWLRDDLGPKSGLILNREVQATRLERLDIKLEAIPPPGSSGAVLSMVIEVKGAWNAGVQTSLGTQLGQKYLLKNGWTHGLYLVGWYHNLAKPSARLKWRPANIEEARSDAKIWESEQALQGCCVRAVVLECPPVTRAKRQVRK